SIGGSRGGAASPRAASEKQRLLGSSGMPTASRGRGGPPSPKLIDDDLVLHSSSQSLRKRALPEDPAKNLIFDAKEPLHVGRASSVQPTYAATTPQPSPSFFQ